MKHERQRQKTIADEIVMNILRGASPLSPGQLIFPSDLINFFIFSSVKINCRLSVSWIWVFFSIPACLLFFFCFFSFLKLKLWRLFPFGILWKQTDRIPLYLDEHSLECQLSGELISSGGTVCRLPPHSCRTSTNTDDRSRDKSYNRPRVRRPSHLRQRSSGLHRTLISAAQSHLWHEFTPGNCG